MTEQNNNKKISNSVFEDLGFDQGEVGNLKIRAHLMRYIVRYIEREAITQTEAAARFGITQPRVSDLIRGKISLFTIDMLVNMLHRIGLQVNFDIEEDPLGSSVNALEEEKGRGAASA